MNKNERIRLIIGTIINVVVFALTVYCLATFIKYALRDDPDNRFRYFTNISNLTVGFTSLVSAVYLIISLIRKKMVYPKVLSIVKFIGLTMTTLTFFTVLFVIAPMTSFPEMYGKVRFITHLVTPIIALVSFFFFEDKIVFEWKYSFLGVVPVVAYSIVYSINVVFLKRWPDLYQINTRGLWFLFIIAFTIASFGLTQGIYFIKKITSKRE